MRSAWFAAAALLAPLAVRAAEPDVTIEVDATKVVQRISPLVYGINHNDFKTRPHIPFTRQGGNRLTAWNWETNASNAGSDWSHQNDAYLGGGDVPGEVVRAFLDPSMKAGKTAIITVPMIGYVAGDKKGDGDVKKTPNYLETRFVKSYPKKKGKLVYPPNLTDKAVYQDEMVWWVNQQFPTGKRNGGQIFYSMDNEPDLWSGTHARIHPKKVTYTEMVERTVDYAGAIKDVDPQAVVFGFVSYGYLGFMNLQTAPDAKGRDFIEFFLTSMREAEQQQHRRLMDVLDLHWYPEARGGGKRVNDRSNAPAVVRARVQAPRSLWDKTYTEDSWITRDAIHGPVALLPAIREKIERCYPGTKLAFTEYDYGGGNHISGAVAEADVLGIFGREGVFAAALWGGGPFIHAAFDAYLNYDGKGSSFGDEALEASSSKVEDVSVYASRSSEDQGKVVMVVINRAEGSRVCRIGIRGLPVAKAELYRIAGSEPKVKSVGAMPFGDAQDVELPAMSVTTMVLGR